MIKTLNKISMVIEEDDITLDELLKKMASILTSAFGNSANCCVEIEIDRALYHSDEFTAYDIVFDFPIIVENRKIGSLRIFPGTDEENDASAFLSEDEYGFARYISMRIGRIVQRYNLSEELMKIRKKLDIKEKQLQHKYIAMQELLDYIEFEREKKNNEIKCNVETSIKPILSNLKLSAEPQKYYCELEKSIENLTSKFNISLKDNYSILTHKEREICNHLKDGRSSKEIGNLLNLSAQTVDKHRTNIRKKLQIDHQKVNLPAFLESMEKRIPGIRNSC